MSLYVLRHGQTHANAYNEGAAEENRLFGGQTETELTAKGVGQMQALGSLYAARRIVFSRVFSSPSGRAVKGAHILLEAMGQTIAVEPIDALAERASGIIAGRTREELLALHPDLAPHFARDPQLRHLRESFEPSGIPGFEDYGAVAGRLRGDVIPLLRSADGAADDAVYQTTTLEEDAGEHPRILVMTHKHTARCLLYELLRLTKEQAVAMDIPNAQPFMLRHAR